MSWSVLAEHVLPILGTVAIGFLGWLAAQGVGSQVMRFYRLREQIHEALIFNDNVGSREEDQERFNYAVLELRKLASKLQALNNAASGPTRCWLRFRGYDLDKAGTRMIGVSNTVASRDASQALQRHGVEKGLRLPLTYTDEQVQQIDAARERRGL